MTTDPATTLAAVQVIKAVADAIRDLGSVPSGELYARLMPHMTLAQYEDIIGILTRTGLIEQKAHVLTWRGKP
jgi:hypothetical protein